MINARQIFMNGEFIPADQGVISVRTHGFSYGTGCFEGIRGYWNEEDQQVYLFRLREHYQRLLQSCKILQITLPYSVDQLVEITTELVRRNEQKQNIYLRPVAYKGDQTIGVRLHGLQDRFIITSEPFGNYIETGGLHCGVSSWRRIDDNAIPARAKITGSYVNSAFAKSEALQNGFDEAIMLTHDGHVSEGSAENIFLVIGHTCANREYPAWYHARNHDGTGPSRAWAHYTRTPGRPHRTLCRGRDIPVRHRSAVRARRDGRSPPHR